MCNAKEDQYKQTITELILKDTVRMNALDAVYQLNLPQGYIAAGFVRNLVWDHLHQKIDLTALNDVDVIYFDPTEDESKKQYQYYEAKLKKLLPSVHWQVRNQALMHTRNNDKPYTSSENAMSYWPEKETAVAIRKVTKDQYECISVFGFESLFLGKITSNPNRARAIFSERVQSKGWLTRWPNLTVMD